MPDRFTKFKPKHKLEFPFLTADPTNEFNGMCVTCRNSFSIKSGGRARITEHIKSKKHIDATNAVKNCTPLNAYF